MKTESFYKALLNLYPKEYREKYAEQMFIIFKDLYRDEMEKHGEIGVSFWIRIIADTVSSMAQQYNELIQKNTMKIVGRVKISKSLIFFIGAIFVTNLFFFSPAYFFGEEPIAWDSPLAIYLYPLPNLVISFVFWMFQPIGTLKKPFLIFATFLLTAFTGFALIFSTMYLPGSKEHNYIMYKVCVPALDKYYAARGQTRLSNPSDKNAKGEHRWWVQHSECEENVRNGKGPVFSENPPGFPPLN